MNEVKQKGDAPTEWSIDPAPRFRPDFPRLAPCLSEADIATRLADPRIKDWLKINAKVKPRLVPRPHNPRWVRLSSENLTFLQEEWYHPSDNPWTGLASAWLPSELGVKDVPPVPERGGQGAYVDQLYFWKQSSKDNQRLTFDAWSGSFLPDFFAKKKRPPAGLVVQITKGGLVSGLILSPHAEWSRIDGLPLPKMSDHLEEGLCLVALPLTDDIIANRSDALLWLDRVVATSFIDGIQTNISAAVSSRLRSEGLGQNTGMLNVHDGGLQTMVVQYPGRRNHWDVGVPPSGPADSLNAVRANRALGNYDNTPLLEITLTKFVFSLDIDSQIALCGAKVSVEVGQGVGSKTVQLPADKALVLQVRSRQVIKIVLGDQGARTYLSLPSGISVCQYLESATTFSLGGFGGWGGRTLLRGDALPFGRQPVALTPITYPHDSNPGKISPNGVWQIDMKRGPQSSSEYFAEGWLDVLYSSDWKVHYNSDRTGTRLVGPRPSWSRPDGGEAGLHPSNLHDNAYVVGSLDFTGDLPIILGQDGPSLGGFASPAVVADSDMWKIGQLRPGDTVRFIRADQESRPSYPRDKQMVFAEGMFANGHSWRILPCGDKAVLIEVGKPLLDLEVRMIIHRLWQSLKSSKVAWIENLTPGIRSLLVQWTDNAPNARFIIGALKEHIDAIEDISHERVDSRIVWLPLSWDDPATRLATTIYQTRVRKDAPWCPDNIEFIRRINGLDSTDVVRKIVFAADYLVMGLGDVYLGAPVATPLDPRHRLVTTKYNPARTWTPENAVGIGGAYLCVYGMEGPGGYQFVGRTIQMWNKGLTSTEEKSPHLLQFFDRIKFYEVGAQDLLDIRRDFAAGNHEVKIEKGTFDMVEYKKFLDHNAQSIASFAKHQKTAYEAERADWLKRGL